MSCACITEPCTACDDSMPVKPVPTRQPPRIPPGRVVPAWPDQVPTGVEPKDDATVSPMTPLQLTLVGGAALGLLYLVCKA